MNNNLLSSSVQRDSFVSNNEHRRFTADPNILKALETLNNSTMNSTNQNKQVPTVVTTMNSNNNYNSYLSGTVTPPIGPSSTNTSAILHSQEKVPQVLQRELSNNSDISIPIAFVTTPQISSTMLDNQVPSTITVTASVKPPLPPSIINHTNDDNTTKIETVPISTTSIVLGTVPLSSAIPVNQTPQFTMEDSFEDSGSVHSSPVGKDTNNNSNNNNSTEYSEEDIGYGEDDLY